MSRCGCGQGCSCRHIAVPPLHIEGNGSPSRPFEHSLEYNGQTGECALVAAVGAHTGPGLRYNQPCELATYASADAGNTVGYGSDGGLYVPDPDNPLPPHMRCVRTVDWLTQQSFWHGGYHGGGANIAPVGSRSTFDVAAEQNLYAVRVVVRFTCEGTPVQIYSTDMSQTSLWNPPAPAGTDIAEITARQARVMTNRVSEHFGYGYADEESLTFLSDVFNIHQDRFVWFLYVEPADAAQGFIPHLRDFLLSRCAADQAVVFAATTNAAQLAPAADAGIAIGVNVTKAVLDGGYTPQQALDAGMTWVMMNADVTPDQYGPFVDAGLHVVGQHQTSRYETDAAMAAGAAGTFSIDPIYTSRQGCGLGYDEWWNPAIMSGQINAATQVAYAYRGVRGVKRPSGGWIPATNPTRRADSILLGWAEAAPAADYGWEFELLFHQDGAEMTDGAAGLAFAAPQDGPCASYAANDGTAFFRGSAILPAFNGYMGQIGSGGNVSLFRVDNGVETRLVTIEPFDGAIVRSRVYRFRAQIAGNTVRFVRLDDDGAEVQVAEAADATYRGGYCHLYKYVGATARSWDVGMRNVRTTDPAPRAAQAETPRRGEIDGAGELPPDEMVPVEAQASTDPYPSGLGPDDPHAGGPSHETGGA